MTIMKLVLLILIGVIRFSNQSELYFLPLPDSVEIRNGQKVQIEMNIDNLELDLNTENE